MAGTMRRKVTHGHSETQGSPRPRNADDPAVCILLDTCILERDFALSSRDLATLGHLCDLAGGRLYVSATSIDELRAHFPRRFRSALDKAADALRRLGSFVERREIPELDPLRGRLAALSAEYATALPATIAELGIETLQYPHVDLGVLVTWASEHRKPFTSSGAGFKDALIWLNVISLARVMTCPVVLVSNDSDFGNEAGLHAQLTESLEAEGISPDRVVLQRDYGDLFDYLIEVFDLKYDLDGEPWAQLTEAQLRQRIESSVDLASELDKLKDTIATLLEQNEYWFTQATTPSDVYLHWAVEPEEMTFDVADYLGEGRWRVLYRAIWPTEVEYIELEGPPGYNEVTEEMPLQIDLSVDYDAREGCVDSVEIDSVGRSDMPW